MGGTERHTHRSGEKGSPLFVSLWTESGRGRRQQASPSVTAHVRIVSDPLGSKWWTHTPVGPTDKWLSPEGGTGLWTLGFACGWPGWRFSDLLASRSTGSSRLASRPSALHGPDSGPCCGICGLTFMFLSPLSCTPGRLSPALLLNSRSSGQGLPACG